MFGDVDNCTYDSKSERFPKLEDFGRQHCRVLEFEMVDGGEALKRSASTEWSLLSFSSVVTQSCSVVST